MMTHIAMIVLQLTHISTDSWKSPIHSYDWLIFRCGNLTLLEKRNENDKDTNFMTKNSKKVPKKCSKSINHIFMNLPH